MKAEADTGPVNVARLVEPVMKSCSLPCPSAMKMLLFALLTSADPVNPPITTLLEPLNDSAALKPTAVL